MRFNKGILIIILMLILTHICVKPSEVNAANELNRYTTQTVKLDKTLKVKANTKVKLIKAGKTKTRIEYKGKEYTVKTKYLHKVKAVNKYKGRRFKRVGRARWNGCSWTWYSQRILPGRGLKIPGRHVDKRGFVCDKDGYICLGSSVANKRKKLVVPTPFGKYGKVYDCGNGGSKWFDVYCNW